MGHRAEAAGLGVGGMSCGLRGMALSLSPFSPKKDALLRSKRRQWRWPTMCGVDWHEMVGLRPKRLVPRYVIASLASRTSASEGRESPVPVRRD